MYGRIRTRQLRSDWPFLSRMSVGRRWSSICIRAIPISLRFLMLRRRSAAVAFRPAGAAGRAGALAAGPTVLLPAGSPSDRGPTAHATPRNKVPHAASTPAVQTSLVVVMVLVAPFASSSTVSDTAGAAPATYAVAPRAMLSVNDAGRAPAGSVA